MKRIFFVPLLFLAVLADARLTDFGGGGGGSGDGSFVNTADGDLDMDGNSIIDVGSMTITGTVTSTSEFNTGSLNVTGSLSAIGAVSRAWGMQDMPIAGDGQMFTIFGQAGNGLSSRGGDLRFNTGANGLTASGTYPRIYFGGPRHGTGSNQGALPFVAMYDMKVHIGHDVVVDTAGATLHVSSGAGVQDRPMLIVSTGATKLFEVGSSSIQTNVPLNVNAGLNASNITILGTDPMLVDGGMKCVITYANGSTTTVCGSSLTVQSAGNNTLNFDLSGGSITWNGINAVFKSSEVVQFGTPFTGSVSTCVISVATTGSGGEYEFQNSQTTGTNRACYKWVVEDWVDTNIVPQIGTFFDRSNGTDSDDRSYIIGISSLTLGVSDPQGVCDGAPQWTKAMTVATNNTGSSYGSTTNVPLTSFNSPLESGRTVIVSVTRLDDASTVNSRTAGFTLWLGRKNLK